MKTKGLFTSLGTRTVAGRRVAVAEHKLNAGTYRIGTVNIPGRDLDEAIAKYEACVARRTENGKLRTANAATQPALQF